MNAVLWIAVEPKTGADREKLARGLAALVAEDPTISVTADPITGETIIGASWEHHLEVIIDRLKREFDVEACVGRPQIAYKALLTRPAQGEAKYATHRGGVGHYAHVKIHVQPAPLGTGFAFHNLVIGGAIPSEFIRPIEHGIKDALATAVLPGYPLEDVRVDLCDGSYHDLDSSETAFKIAAATAFQKAVRDAGPLLLEPVMRVRVSVNHEDAEDVVGNLVSRRGEIQSQESRGDMRTIEARVPLAELFGYSGDLRSRTRGRGTVVGVELAGYAPAPPFGDDDDRDSHVGAPRKPPSPRRTFGIALPEPDADDTIV